METSATIGPPLRSTYRHGDLRRALLEAGIELARHGGPDAVVLREATRRAGVVPNAAYRHFASRRELLRAVGTAYLRFAQRETGLFRAGFAPPDDSPNRPDPDKAGPGGRNPFELLGDALDRLVEAGALPPERRLGTEYLAWSAVHGLAMLVIDGPLHRLPAAQVDDIGQHLLDMVEKGL